MRARSTVRALALASAAWLGLAATAQAPAPAVDALVSGARLHLDLAELAAREPLASDEDFRVRELARDAHTSHHLVWIRKAEAPHRHDQHDLFVVILRGYGTMLLENETRPVGEGSILYVPRGTPHAFTNQSGAPAVAYAIYSPPFDGKDRVAPDAPR